MVMKMFREIALALYKKFARGQSSVKVSTRGCEPLGPGSIPGSDPYLKINQMCVYREIQELYQMGRISKKDYELLMEDCKGLPG